LAGLDNLLAESLQSVIEQKLGSPTFQKIKDRLIDRYEVTVVDAIKDFYKMDATLREFFGSGADEIEKDFLGNFISFGSTQNQKVWITIHDQSLADLILNSFGDTDKRLILENSMREPKIILDILNHSNIPKSSGYRMVKELIKNGLLAEQGFVLANDGRKLIKFTSLFDNIKIDIQENKTLVKVQINKEFIKDSLIANVLLSH